MEKQTHKFYEVGYSVVPTVSQSEVEGVVRKLVSYVEAHGGEVKGGEFPSMMDLAYPIDQKIETIKKTFKNAYFGWFNFVSTPEAAVEIHADIKKDNSILRFILITKKHDDTPEGDMFDQNKKASKEGNIEEVEDEIDEEKLDEALGEMVEDDA